MLLYKHIRAVKLNLGLLGFLRFLNTRDNAFIMDPQFTTFQPSRQHGEGNVILLSKPKENESLENVSCGCMQC